MHMSRTSVSTIAYYLALIGGILMVLLGLLGFAMNFGAYYLHWGFAYSGIVTLIMGVIAIVGARSARYSCLGNCIDNCWGYWRRIRRVARASRWNYWLNCVSVKKSQSVVCVNSFPFFMREIIPISGDQRTTKREATSFWCLKNSPN